MKRLWLAMVAIPLTGCGTGALDFGQDDPKETGQTGLRRFESDTELVGYFQRETSRESAVFGDLILGDSAADGGGAAAPGAAEGSPGRPSADDGGGGGSVGQGVPQEGEDADGLNYSDTTIQEDGVDEADVVKTDGQYLYIIDGGLMRIVDVRSADAITEAGRVELEGYGQDLFFVGDKVVALTQVWNWWYGDVALMMDGMGMGGASAGIAEGEPGPMDGPSVALTVIDVADRAAPKVLSTTRFEGNIVSSRMIGERVHLALAIYPNDFGRVFPVGNPAMKSVSLAAKDILPDYEFTDAAGAKVHGEMMTWGDVYHPIDPDGYGMVSVISLDISNASQFHAIGVMANPGLTYASLDAFYLTDTQWTFWGDERETTDVYKFNYTDTGVSLAAVGAVPGRILNQYSMSEFAGNFRVATTTVNWTETAVESGNHVYVLGQNADKLDIVGKLENLAPGESIQAARFLGNRGYLVTFEQVDPLFTLDLSNPVEPKVVGELKVPGFSTFIVPMDENHLLTVGNYIADGDLWSTGVQLSIFDVTDFAAPALKHQAVIADGAWSEALWNPKALTYFAEAGYIALPVTVPDVVFFDDDFVIDEGTGAEDGDASSGSTEGDDGTVDEPPIWEPPIYRDKFQGLVVYTVGTDAGFSEVMRLDTRLDDEGWTWWPAFTRGVFIDSRVLAVTNLGVIGGDVTVPDAVGASLQFEQPDWIGWGEGMSPMIR